MGTTTEYTESTERDQDALTQQVIGAAIEVHRNLGPGLLESAYEACLAYELQAAGLTVWSQVPLPLKYKKVKLDCAYRLDLVVDRQLIVEIKTVRELLPIHQAQLLSYMKISGCRKGLLINFHEQLLKDGIKRMVL